MWDGNAAQTTDRRAVEWNCRMAADGAEAKRGEAGERRQSTPKNVISDETIEYVGILAKLELDDEEKERAKKDMGRCSITLTNSMNWTRRAWNRCRMYSPVNNVFREDVVTNGDGSADGTLANAR